MRAILDLSDEVHGLALSMARDEGVTLSEAVNRLILEQTSSKSAPPRKKRRSRLPIFECVRRVSSEDVRKIEDDLRRFGCATRMF